MFRKSLFSRVGQVVQNVSEPDQYHRTRPNLAVTPSQMMEMAAHGMPISLQNSADFHDGDTNPSWDISPERVRGIDAADLWQLQQSTRGKLKKAVLAQKAADKSSAAQ